MDLPQLESVVVRASDGARFRVEDIGSRRPGFETVFTVRRVDGDEAHELTVGDFDPEGPGESPRFTIVDPR